MTIRTGLAVTSAALVAIALAGGCARMQKQVSEEAYSGYLGDLYPKLQATKSASGESVNRWVSPTTDFKKYKSIIIERVEFYPPTQGDERVSQQQLVAFQDKMDAALRREIGKVLTLTTAPGAGTLRLKAAITGVAAENKGLKAWQILPVALVLAGVTQAAGVRDQDVVVHAEFLVQDSASGEAVAAGVKKGFGDDLEGRRDNVGQRNLDTVVNNWAKDAYTMLGELTR